MFIVKVNLALNDVYGALDTDQQSRQYQIVYHNKIYPSIPGSTPHSWLYEVSSAPRIYPTVPEYAPF